MNQGLSIIDYIFRVLMFYICSKELKPPGLIAETQTANQETCRLLEKVGKKRVKTLSALVQSKQFIVY
jgi:hypothetical protein